MNKLLAVEPRVAEASVKEPAVQFNDGDELHARPGAACCCWDHDSRAETAKHTLFGEMPGEATS